MSKLKLEHGVSRIRRTKLQSSIDQSIADDIEMLAEWSNNETNYVVNELLRFALAQEEEFQKHKASSSAHSTRSAGNPKSGPLKPATDASPKMDASTHG